MTSNHLPDEDANIQDCAQSIKQMLSICNASHTSTCKAGNLRQTPEDLGMHLFVPKRLLRVSNDEVSFQVRLIETATCGTSFDGGDFRYTALSHCWGSIEIIKTTKATVSGFKRKGIKWAYLPKTFQEALILTHKLGINYVWIDSLCKCT